MGWQDRVFRALTRLLPAEFRGDYEQDMTATFRAERRGAGSAASLMRFWLATVADIFRTAPAEHLDILQRDLRHAVRVLRKTPVFTVAAIGTLALGIGANTTIFSLVHTMLIRPLPYQHPHQVVMVFEDQTAGGFPKATPSPAAYFFDPEHGPQV